MTESCLNELYNLVDKEKIFINEPMSRHTSFKIGGPAEVFVKATTINDIRNVIQFTRKNNMPLNIIGNGSNLLVKDEGIKGIVLKPQLTQIKIEKENNDINVRVESGVTIGYLAQKLLQESITGFEELSGIPGTIGGAVRMNAGAHGKEIKDIVEKTTYMDMQGDIHTITNKDHQFQYRNSIFIKEKYIVIETTFKLKSGNKETIKTKMEEFLKWRKENQPLDYPNAGSTFKRGKNFVTAKIIDECGLKGFSVGGAQVSTKHAGFIINTGNATAKDVLSLIDYVTQQVYSKTGEKIELEIEVI
ncbi:MAG: UDP-N-acetylmuramate dehydrogenase [Clostridia bacterium]|nr:UDP-N-acetylmuramate dehydrogenase [Clostridia bacterium]